MPDYWKWQEQFKPAMWLDESTPEVRRAIVCRAITDIGICENPAGSNRSGRIDSYFKRLNVPIGQYWCGAWVTQVWFEVGAATPPAWRGAACEEWRKWAIESGRFVSRDQPPTVGDAVLYGTNGKANHIEILTRLTPYVISVGGNRAWSGFSTNGEAVTMNRVDTGRVLGFVRPI